MGSELQAQNPYSSPINCMLSVRNCLTRTLEQAALDDLMAFENPMVLESMEGKR